MPRIKREMIGRGDMISTIVERLELKSIDVRKTLEFFMNTIVETLEKDGVVEIRGFGTFRLRRWKQRKGICGRDRKAFVIKPFNKIKFVMTKELKERLNKEKINA